MSHEEWEARPQRAIGARIFLGSMLWIAAFAAVCFAYIQHRQAVRDAHTAAVAAERTALEQARALDANAAGPEAGHATPAPDDPQAEAVPVWPAEGVMDFSLTERSGRTVTKADLLGRPWAVCFVFTRCAGPCPRLAGQMHILQDKLKDTDVRLVTITVDPEYDTPEVMQRFAKAYNADPDRWWFLTGDKVLIYEMITKSFQMPVAEAGGTFLHSNNIMHVNAQGRVAGKYNGLKDEEAAALYRALRQEAEQNKESD